MDVLDSMMREIGNKRNQLIEDVCRQVLGRNATKEDAKDFNLVIDQNQNTYIAYKGIELGRIVEEMKETNWTITFEPKHEYNPK